MDKRCIVYRIVCTHENTDVGKISLALANKCCCRNSEIIPVTHRVATPAESFFDGNVNAVPTAATFSHLSNPSVYRAIELYVWLFFYYRVSGATAICHLWKKKIPCAGWFAQMRMDYMFFFLEIRIILNIRARGFNACLLYIYDMMIYVCL